MVDVVADPYLWALLAWLVGVAVVVQRVTGERWIDVGSSALGTALVLIGIRWTALVDPDLLAPVAVLLTGSALIFWPHGRGRTGTAKAKRDS